MNELRTGIIGMGGFGAKVLAELGRKDCFTIRAVADQNKELAQEYGVQYEAEPYDDYRSLIVQEDLDVLFLALPTYLCGECINLAVQAGMHIFKEAPLGRNLPEAMQWVQQMEKSGLHFHVSARKRFAPSYQYAHELLVGGSLGKIYLVRGESFIHFPQSRGGFDWRGDPILSGGGVLLEHAYHMIDQIVWNMGTPERLYSINSNFCSKQVLPPYRTEDTAVLTMNFHDGVMGNIIAGWMTGPEQERLIFHGTEGSLEVNAEGWKIFDPGGNIQKKKKYKVDESEMISLQIRQFAESLLDAEVKPQSTAREHLANVAIIESAYLSGRTQLPESLKVYGSLFEI